MGCAPKECREGSLICDRCYGRARKLLDDAADLLARLTAIADPLKATVLQQIRVATHSSEPPAPVADDLLDAITAVRVAAHFDPALLPAAANNLFDIGWLSHNVLDRHPPVDGIRSAWSLQDAVDRWGVERREADTFIYPVEDEEEEASPVTEWYDPLLTVQQAAKRVGVDQRTVQRWVKRGIIEPVTKVRGPRGSVLSYFRASTVDTTAEIMRVKSETA